MRPFILASCLLLFLSFHSTAQSSFNLEGGLNLSKVEFTNSDLFNPQTRSGFYVGFRQRISLSEKLFFNYTLQYVRDGYESNISGASQSPSALEKIEYRYHYFRLIPHFEFQPYSMISAFIGPNFGLAFKEELNIDEQEWVDVGEDDFIENVDIGATIGLRYHLKKLTVTASYYHGFSKTSNFMQSDNGVDIRDVYERNRSFQIGVGYAFLAS